MTTEVALLIAPAYLCVGAIMTGLLTAIDSDLKGWAYLFGLALWPLTATLAAAFLTLHFFYDIGHRMGDGA